LPQTAPNRRSAARPLFAAPLFVVALLLALGPLTSPPTPAAAQREQNLEAFPDPSGVVRTMSTLGAIDPHTAFFQSLGTNGRACITCHGPGEGWTLTPAGVKQRFDASDGLEPLFRTNDGSNSPNAKVDSLNDRKKAYSMLLNRAVIRVGLPIPPGAEFELVAVDDPYGFASASELSLFRRPLPSTNLRFLSAVMWDGRENSGNSLEDTLKGQAQGATLGHAQAFTGLTDEQAREIVSFELSLFTAQDSDNAAGELQAQGAKGGPVPLSQQKFFIGINDPLGQNPTGAPFDPDAFSIFNAWEALSSADTSKTTAARLAVERGQALFNTQPITITGVKGLNDDQNVSSIPGTCTTCHDAPNVGNHSVKAPLDIGLTDASRRTSDMPLYTFRKKGSGERVQTTDPGRALISGKWQDIGRFKGPVLRGLAARAPYFHNGSAATLDDVVNFYNGRFDMNLTSQEKADLVAFLKAL
jgi:RoxA-like, cytochrome c-like